ncbi:H-NS family nucleoid-associated regulatory protein [Cupriavidus sp. AU9028]|uniref:H-NS family nucleoid-associated regulatory protein n=1 Tax=Cupriavidus sp. AU9028 TaxID=2871157 RepID=UPI001C961EDC|nr:H-NS family nucleoid-associated regulatory protein [Cupriavidus sp. AU9028]MBY4897840.1 H-NS histone family protein [Cupriavidus sp. AU9028]
MSEFDDARLAAVEWIRAQMDRYGLSLDDLEAAGCFDETVPNPTAADVPQPESQAAHAAPAPQARPAATPLYRNALGQTWDGTGDMPDWLQRAVNAGQSPDFYRVG